MLLRQVAGDSMEPTLSDGRIVVAVPTRNVKQGDVVIVRHGGLEKVKRVARRREDELFIIGDNKAHSTDSRSFGWVSDDTIIAKVVWPRTGKLAR